MWSDSAKFCDFGFISQDLQNFDTLFLIWQNIKPILANLLHCWLIFIVPNGPILNYNLTIRSNVGLKTHVQTEQKCESLLCHLISVFELPSKFFYRNEHCIAFKNPQQGSKRMCKLNKSVRVCFVISFPCLNFHCNFSTKMKSYVAFILLPLCRLFQL